jgi:DNA ligase-1
LARFGGIEEAVIAHRLMGNWDPEPVFWDRLLSLRTDDADFSRPYPFFLAYPLDAGLEELGPMAEWQAEWKWDGIRAQVIHRRGQVFIWSRGEELVTEKFPEIRAAAQKLPEGCVLDGEILAWNEGRPLGFAALQRRIGRKHPARGVLQSGPVALMAYDLLEVGSEDVRARELAWRAAALEDLLSRLEDPRL